MERGICPNCKKTFEKSRSDKVYCSKKCKEQSRHKKPDEFELEKSVLQFIHRKERV